MQDKQAEIVSLFKHTAWLKRESWANVLPYKHFYAFIQIAYPQTINSPFEKQVLCFSFSLYLTDILWLLFSFGTLAGLNWSRVKYIAVGFDENQTYVLYILIRKGWVSAVGFMTFKIIFYHTLSLHLKEETLQNSTVLVTDQNRGWNLTFRVSFQAH